MLKEGIPQGKEIPQGGHLHQKIYEQARSAIARMSDKGRERLGNEIGVDSKKINSMASELTEIIRDIMSRQKPGEGFPKKLQK
jgi:hypothetical protein